MTTVNLDEADLAGLLARVRTGEEIAIADDGVPVARLVPERAAPAPAPRRPGSARGLIKILPGFDDPLPEDIRAGP